MSISAMEKALKALEKIYEGCGYVIEEKLHKDAMDLAGFVRKDCIEPIKVLNQTIQQQTGGKWVGLTDDEIKEIVGPWGDTPIKGYTRYLFDKIEAKLKEKNCG